MKLKSTVVVKPGLSPEILLAIMVADSVFKEHGSELIITSIFDSHDDRPKSLHHKGYAVDLRTRHLRTGEGDIIKNKIQVWLGGAYDVILEKDHIHMEFDPKI